VAQTIEHLPKKPWVQTLTLSKRKRRISNERSKLRVLESKELDKGQTKPKVGGRKEMKKIRNR
jgi:hypothetical protein